MDKRTDNTNPRVASRLKTFKLIYDFFNPAVELDYLFGIQIF